MPAAARHQPAHYRPAWPVGASDEESERVGVVERGIEEPMRRNRTAKENLVTLSQPPLLWRHRHDLRA